MALDMELLRRMFYEECRENLEVLEDILLNLDPAQVEKDLIDTIFRAAHSIKGGAATFNLLDISEFTHTVEAYLDKVRNGELVMTRESVDVLLRSCDGIRILLEGHESGEAVESDSLAGVSQELAQLLLGNDSNSSDALGETSDNEVESQAAIAPFETETSATTTSQWQVKFRPHPTIFYSGNDPLRILRELNELDEHAQLTCDTSQLPDIQALDPELCYTHWFITLSGEVEKSQIEEIFEWVEDECDLEITALPAVSTYIEQETPTTPTVQPEREVAQTEPTTVVADAAKPVSRSSKNSKSDSAVTSIRVDIDKVDNLINLVGELVITQSMLAEIGSDFSIDKLDKLKAGLDQLLQNSKDLQEHVLNIRMLPMSFAFSRFPRLVRDLCGRLGKEVDLQIHGEHTELDKTVLERIVDPLVHLVRNGIDHGIEMPNEREQKGKPSFGTLTLNAFHQGGSIIIEVKDDGAGINCDRIWQKAVEKKVLPADSRREEMSDKQIINLIFAPGFSTADQVSDISGRGVGMDVVKRNIEELGGHIEVESLHGQGSNFTISLPLTLAILDGQLMKVAGEVYVIPLLTIIESIQIDPNYIKHAAGGVELYRLREENIPILRLQHEFDMGNSREFRSKILCVVEAAGTRVGLLIDELLDQQQVVIKSLESNYQKVPGISGATILGDGSVSLILDVQGLITTFLKRRAESGNSGMAA
ncbi:TPA: chemotaxis protein CheA [Vibrio vulnificus]|nr:chemotaxis protein CheA [Vibrio vulnificus]